MIMIDMTPPVPPHILPPERSTLKEKVMTIMIMNQRSLEEENNKEGGKDHPEMKMMINITLKKRKKRMRGEEEGGRKKERVKIRTTHQQLLLLQGGRRGGRKDHLHLNIHPPFPHHKKERSSKTKEAENQKEIIFNMTIKHTQIKLTCIFFEFL